VETARWSIAGQLDWWVKNGRNGGVACALLILTLALRFCTAPAVLVQVHQMESAQAADAGGRTGKSLGSRCLSRQALLAEATVRRSALA
jgi:hypothetical protein